MRRRARRLLLGAVARAGILLAGAGSPSCAADALPSPSLPTSVEPVAAGLDADFRMVEAVGQGIRMPLPDADAWRRDPRETMTWVASHGATDSRLLVRTFHPGGVARSEDCEQQMRTWRRDLPALAPEQRAETRRLRLDGGYSGQLVTGAAQSASHVVTGYALLFASDGRECLCLAFSTSASGASAASIVGARLGSVTRGAFERTQRIGIEANVRAPER